MFYTFCCLVFLSTILFRHMLFSHVILPRDSALANTDWKSTFVHRGLQFRSSSSLSGDSSGDFIWRFISATEDGLYRGKLFNQRETPNSLNMSLIGRKAWHLYIKQVVEIIAVTCYQSPLITSECPLRIAEDWYTAVSRVLRDQNEIYCNFYERKGGIENEWPIWKANKEAILDLTVWMNS